MKRVEFTAKNAREAKKLLREYFRAGSRVGSGAFASVFETDGKDVVKIGHTYDAYVHYVRYIERSKWMPFFPKIKKFATVSVRGENSMYGVLMERLHRPSTARMKARLRVVCAMFDQWNDWGDDAFGSIKSAILSGYTPNDLKALNRMYDRLSKLAKNSEADLDMHDGNFMFRKNGDLVITDPIAG